MKRSWMVWACLAIGVVSLSTPGHAQVKAVDPVGKYAIITVDDTGAPLQGTLTIGAGGGAAAGQFESSALPQPVPVVTVATNADRLLIVLDTGQGLALVNLQQQKDGGFKGLWHKLSDGSAVTATKAK